MTELNERPEKATEPAELPGWPDLVPFGHPIEKGSTGTLGRGGDPMVGGALRRLLDVPNLPVTEHGPAYEEIHDALLQALNEDPSARSGTS